jgi:hypothetical protein|tara:strand:- start:882 stop:1274 length:393 start_codon:yes stop_codon:yes gene_type:complete
MIKRLYQIARSNIGYYFEKPPNTDYGDPISSTYYREEADQFQNKSYKKEEDHLARYFANLELTPSANRSELKASWKRLMKKYHPDLHSSDQGKKKIANELTQGLTEAYKILDKELAKREVKPLSINKAPL